VNKEDTTDFGGKTNYYQVFNDCNDVDDFCAKYNVNFFMGNVLKAAVRIYTKKYELKNGDIRDLNKIIHYTQLEKNRRLKLIEP
jgi:hypothetical protein